MNSQQLHKRTVNLDILRIIALIFIPCLHYFLYTGFYSKELSSNFMYVAYFARNLFLLGLPMFMLLTGFLHRILVFEVKSINQQINQSYYNIRNKEFCYSDKIIF